MIAIEEVARSLVTVTSEYTKCTIRTYMGKPEKNIEVLHDTIKRLHNATEFITRRLGHDSAIVAKGFMDTFMEIYGIIRDNVNNNIDEAIVCDVVNRIYRMYKNYHLRLEYLDEFPAEDHCDVLLLYLMSKCGDYRDKVITIIKNRIHNLIISDMTEVSKAKMLTESTSTVYTESVLDNVNHPTASAYVDNQIAIYGDSRGHQSYLNGISSESLKRELLHLVGGKLMRYMDPTVKEIDYNIPSQMKMYLQAELNTSAIVANLRLGDTVHFLTILHYDGDNFLLFTKDTDPSTVYGISLNEQEGTNERKMLSIGKDDDVNFELVIQNL